MTTGKKIKEFFVPPTPDQRGPGLLDLTDDQMVTLKNKLQTNINKLPAAQQRFTYTHWFVHQLVSFRQDKKGALPMQANDIQVGGSHYKQKVIQPWDAIPAWGLGFLDGNAVKYLARWRHKNGLQDLRKAQHYISKLIEEEEARLAAIGAPVPLHTAAASTPTPPPPGIEPPLPPEAPAVFEEEVDEDVAEMAAALTQLPQPPQPVRMKAKPKPQPQPKPQAKA